MDRHANDLLKPKKVKLKICQAAIPRLKTETPLKPKSLYCYVEYEIQHPTRKQKIYGKTKKCVYYEFFEDENLVPQLWDAYIITDVFPLTQITFKICSFRTDSSIQDKVITCGKIVFDNNFIHNLLLNGQKYEYLQIKMERPKNNPNKEELYCPFSDQEAEYFKLRIKVFRTIRLYEYFQQKNVQMFIACDERNRLEGLKEEDNDELSDFSELGIE